MVSPTSLFANWVAIKVLCPSVPVPGPPSKPGRLATVPAQCNEASAENRINENTDDFVNPENVERRSAWPPPPIGRRESILAISNVYHIRWRRCVFMSRCRRTFLAFLF